MSAAEGMKKRLTKNLAMRLRSSYPGHERPGL
jgi:hypothetical protein